MDATNEVTTNSIKENNPELYPEVIATDTEVIEPDTINSNETVIIEKTNEELAETYGDPNSMASTDESDELKEDLKSLAETTESDTLE